MRATAMSLLSIFESKLRLEVPLFQRQYVWEEERQWAPLWEDIARKFSEYLQGRKRAPVHFLGAMVLDQKQSPTGHVEKRQVIDGQQRLTTFQIFLAAFRDYCRETACVALADECARYTFNIGLMAGPDEEFKVWPTQLDRTQFKDVVAARSRAALEKRYPLVRRKYAKKPEPRPRMVEAYLFFHDQLREFFAGTPQDPPIAAGAPLASRLEECFQALKGALHVVAIDLEQDDDAQVIFETLNARGEPLLPADLLRNYVFLRASRGDESPESLYEQYWRKFDDEFWREPVKQGRLTRPRSDIFMQHFLSSRQGLHVPIAHLFVEYRFWIESARPFPSVREELAALSRQRDDFRRIVSPDRGDKLFGLASFLEAFDIRTVYPLLLALCDSRMTDAEWPRVTLALESFLLRRSVCSRTTKSYTNVFLALTRSLRESPPSAAGVVEFLASQSVESAEWPSDAAFSEAWRTQPVYLTMTNAKLAHVFGRLNSTYLNRKMESLTLDGPLTVEHLLPQSWHESWPLADGSTGLTDAELGSLDNDDPRGLATRRREAMIQTSGNLTVLSQPLNSAASNAAWNVKRPEILKHSLLPINQQLQEFQVWNEDTIARRGEALLERALQLWPRP